jgi:5-bromo-4-chloroindolyl phosphate hydrolysis protein
MLIKSLYLVILLFAVYPHSDEKKVYICDSPKAKKYHLKNDCRGLSHCTHRIIKIDLGEAKKRKFELCKYEK